MRRRQRRRRSPAQHGDSARPAPPHLMARHRHCLWLTCAAKAWAMFFLLLSSLPPPPQKKKTRNTPSRNNQGVGVQHMGVVGGGWRRGFTDSRNLEFAGRGQKKSANSNFRFVSFIGPVQQIDKGYPRTKETLCPNWPRILSTSAACARSTLKQELPVGSEFSIWPFELFSELFPPRIVSATNCV